MMRWIQGKAIYHAIMSIGRVATNQRWLLMSFTATVGEPFVFEWHYRNQVRRYTKRAAPMIYRRMTVTQRLAVFWLTWCDRVYRTRANTKP